MDKEKLYLYAQLLLRHLPYEKQALPLEEIRMIKRYRRSHQSHARKHPQGADWGSILMAHCPFEQKQKPSVTQPPPLLV